MNLYPEFTTMVLLAYPQHVTGEAVGVELALVLVVEDAVINMVEGLFINRIEELGAEEIEVVVIMMLEVRGLPMPVGELLEPLLAVVDIEVLVEELLGIVIVPIDVKAVGENETDDPEFEDCE